MRVAIIHYWLVGMRGGERVLERLLNLFPGADVFTHVYDPAKVSAVIRAANVKTTYIQRFPGSTKHYQKYLPLMPGALERLDLSAYDLVISSEAGPAKGVITRPDAIHVCYCHSPMRYIWDQGPLYREHAGVLSKLGMDLFSHHLRIWDVTSAQRVDRFMANSTFISQRINKFYRRQSDIVFPPVDVDAFQISKNVGAHYLWLGQLTAYKRPDLAVDAFNELGLPLLMVGDGELERSLQRSAGPTISFRKNLSFGELKTAYATARGMIFTAQEDFGIVPVEMMASGRPVLAYAGGGALDTVVANVSGQFFESQTVESLVDSVRDFERWLPEFSPQRCRESTLRFAPHHFDAGVLASIEAARQSAHSTPQAFLDAAQ